MAVTVRSITDAGGFHAVEELQRAVWSMPDLEVVPLHQLRAAVSAGGVLLGAFDEHGTLVGFFTASSDCATVTSSSTRTWPAYGPACRTATSGSCSSGRNGRRRWTVASIGWCGPSIRCRASTPRLTCASWA